MVARSEIIDMFGVKFRRFLFDNFTSTEMLNEAVVQTGSIIKYPFELQLTTGVQTESSAKLYYKSPAFNPKYSELIIKACLSSVDNVFMFFGFKETASNPSDTMTESHAGFIVKDSKLYTSTCNGEASRTAPEQIFISDIDPTNVKLFKIEYDKFSVKPLPIIYPYFDGFRTEKPERRWSKPVQNATIPPKNKDHYLMAYIENTTGAVKTLRLNHIVYGEEYAD